MNHQFPSPARSLILIYTKIFLIEGQGEIKRRGERDFSPTRGPKISDWFNKTYKLVSHCGQVVEREYTRQLCKHIFAKQTTQLKFIFGKELATFHYPSRFSSSNLFFLFSFNIWVRPFGKICSSSGGVSKAETQLYQVYAHCITLLAKIIRLSWNISLQRVFRRSSTIDSHKPPEIARVNNEINLL